MVATQAHHQNSIASWLGALLQRPFLADRPVWCLGTKLVGTENRNTMYIPVLPQPAAARLTPLPS